MKMQYTEDNFTYPHSIHGVKQYPFISHSLKAEFSPETSVTWFLFVVVDVKSFISWMQFPESFSDIGTFSSLVILLYIMPPVQSCLTQAIYLEYFSISLFHLLIERLKVETSNKDKILSK